MRYICRAVLITLAVVLALPVMRSFTQVQGQGAPPVQQPGPPGTYRVRVNLVPVDVIVTDSHGRPIQDLKQEDFSITENGKPQEIKHFTVQTFEANAPMPEQASILRAIPTAELAPQTSRVFLILMGQGKFQVPFKSVDALVKFVRTSLLPQDRVAFFAYNRASDFTTDHEKIAQVIEAYKIAHESIASRLDNFHAGLNSLFGSKEFPKTIQPDVDKIFDTVAGLGSRQVPQGRMTAGGRIAQDWQKLAGMILANPTDVGADSTISSLEQDMGTLWLPFDEFALMNRNTIEDMTNIFTCIEYLRYVEGEKHLLFFSERGLYFPFGNTECDQGIAAAANDARVAIDAFQTGGLSSAGSVPGAGARGVAEPTNYGETFAVMSIRNIARLTGGNISVYEDVLDSLGRVNSSSRVEYLLGYYPKEEKWDGGFRTINVKVNRSGAKVLFRHGYYAREQLQPYDPVEFRAWSRLNLAGDMGARRREIPDIPMDIKYSKIKDAADQTQFKIDLKIDAKRISFRTLETLHVARLRSAIFYADADGKYLGSNFNNIDLQLTDQNYQAAMQAGISASQTIPRKSSTEFVVFVIYDMGGDRLGSRWIMCR